MLHRLKMMALAFISLTVTFVIVAPSASAAGSETIVSRYDSQHEDTLELLVSYTTAECDKKGGGGSTPWFSDLQVTNGSETIDIDVSFVPNTGGTLNPDTSAMYRYSSSGSSPFTASFTFQVNLDGAESETANISIPAPEPGCDSTDAQAVNCYLNNYTDPSVTNEDGSWPLGTTFNLTAHVTDPDSRVEHFVFSFVLPDSKSNDIQSGPDNSVSWTPTEPGTWRVVAQLFDSNGDEIIPTGDCDVSLTMKAAATGQPTTTPVTTDPTPTVTPANNTPAVPGYTTNPDNVPADPNVLASATTAETVDTLPVTGTSTTVLLIAGLLLVVIGTVCVKFGKQKPIVDPTWSTALAELGKK